jgi:transposase-like protein
MKYHSLDYKLSAIKYYKKVKNYSLVSRIFGCNRTSLIRWVKLYENNKLVSKHNKIRKSYKVKEKHVNYIKKLIHLKNYRFISLEKLNNKIKKKFKERYGASLLTTSRLFGVSKKRVYWHSFIK